MKLNDVARTRGSVLILGTLLAVPVFSAMPTLPTRQADEDVRTPTLRTKPGLTPKGTLLFSGWGVTPAGDHVAISDMALKFVISPDKKMLVAASAGFNDTGLTLINMAAKRVSQFLPLPQVWNGLAFGK